MLTTPVIKDEDLVFPGENWFLYWKTSASLWKSKIEALSGVHKILIPLYWGYHSDTGDKYDFANEKPETDLKKLVQICEDLGKEAIFLQPITPMPYLPNGGLPFLLARTQAVDKKGALKCYVDSNGSINQFYSYFDPRIFKAFTKFNNELQTYFSNSGIGASIYAVEGGEFFKGTFSSYLKDYSEAFQNGFSRFLSAKNEEEALSNINRTIEQEHNLYLEYEDIIRDLYLNNVKKELNICFQGYKRIGFILGGTDQVFKRSIDNISDSELIREALEMLQFNILPSSMLIPPSYKTGIFGEFKKQVLGKQMIELILDEKTVSSNYEFAFTPSYTFRIIQNEKEQSSLIRVLNSGFVDHLLTKFPWDFSFRDYQEFDWEDELESSSNFYYFQGGDLEVKTLSIALKMFMNGVNVIIDKNGLNDSLKRRLESFYIENDLDIERIRYLSLIETISMGEGRLFIFDSSELMELKNSQEKKDQFWSKVFSSIEFPYPQMSIDHGVYFLWFERSVSSSELSFEKVKRISLYNPTSYKKRIKIKYPSQYVFQKIVDEKSVTVNNSTHEVEVNFLPKGTVSLDFGVML